MSSRQLQELDNCQVAGFISKTFEILNNQQFSKIAYWAPSGSEFIIKDTNKFQSIVLPRYFRHNKMNSFIRQLNMYGFHKNRADHSKCVFSHSAFLKGREDLLITIKRKIKGKIDVKNEESFETPVKRRVDLEAPTTGAKKMVETGYQLLSENQLVQTSNNGSYNMLGTREKLNSLLNINYTVNALPLAELGEVERGDNDDDVSIADKIQLEQERKEQKQGNYSYKFMNPSCFFQSMRKYL